MLTKKRLFCAILLSCVLLAACEGRAGQTDQTGSSNADTQLISKTYEEVPTDPTDVPPYSDPDFEFSAADAEIANDGNWTPFY